jgi:hypothetical protein
LRIVPLLFGLTAICKADLILHYTGALLTPCVDGLGCQVGIDLVLFNPLPADFFAADTDPSFHQFVSTATTATDGIHTLQASWGTNATGFIGTNDFGNPIIWDIFVEGAIDGSRFETIQSLGGQENSGSLVRIITNGRSQEFSAGPGTWVVTPEPSSALFLGTVIFCVVLMCRGRMSTPN